jgi:hypothetical protein
MTSKTFCYVATLLPISLASSFCRADPVGYSDEVTLVANNKSLICIHEHNYKMPYNGPSYSKIIDTLKRKPIYQIAPRGYISCQRNEKILFKKPSPPLSKMYIQNQIVFGITDVKMLNDIQYIAFTSAGELLLQGHVASEEICILSNDWESNTFLQENKLTLIPYTTKVGDVFHLDILERNSTWPNEYHDFFSTRRCTSHLSPFFHGTVSNYITWYDPTDPNPSIDYNGEKKTWQLRIKDPTGVYIYVP